MLAIGSFSRCAFVGLAARGPPPLRKCRMSASALRAPPVPLADGALFRQQGYIDGAWCDADDGASLDVLDPASGLTIGTVADMGAAETRRAIGAAEAAWPAWRAKTGKERSAVLRAWYELIIAHKEDLAALMTAECGKPLGESLGEVAYAASFVEWFGEEAKRVYGDLIPQHAPGKRILVMKQPVGVVGAITPWNFPAAMITRKCAPALAVGCPVVVTPSELTLTLTLALALTLTLTLTPTLTPTLTLTLTR